MIHLIYALGTSDIRGCGIEGNRYNPNFYNQTEDIYHMLDSPSSSENDILDLGLEFPRFPVVLDKVNQKYSDDEICLTLIQTQQTPNDQQDTFFLGKIFLQLFQKGILQQIIPSASCLAELQTTTFEHPADYEACYADFKNLFSKLVEQKSEHEPLQVISCLGPGTPQMSNASLLGSVGIDKADMLYVGYNKKEQRTVPEWITIVNRLQQEQLFRDLHTLMEGWNFAACTDLLKSRRVLDEPLQNMLINVTQCLDKLSLWDTNAESHLGQIDRYFNQIKEELKNSVCNLKKELVNTVRQCLDNPEVWNGWNIILREQRGESTSALALLVQFTEVTANQLIVKKIGKGKGSPLDNNGDFCQEWFEKLSDTHGLFTSNNISKEKVINQINNAGWMRGIFIRYFLPQHVYQHFCELDTMLKSRSPDGYGQYSYLPLRILRNNTPFGHDVRGVGWGDIKNRLNRQSIQDVIQPILNDLSDSPCISPFEKGKELLREIEKRS